MERARMINRQRPDIQECSLAPFSGTSVVCPLYPDLQDTPCRLNFQSFDTMRIVGLTDWVALPNASARSFR